MTDQPIGLTEQDRQLLVSVYLKHFVHKLSTRSRTVEVEVLPKIESVRELTEVDLLLLREVDQHIRAKRFSEVPAMCEWLMCMAVDPEFQEDRLADFQERFNGLWRSKFGRRGAIAMYVWHVLRQSRLLDWLIRVFRWGAPL